MGTRNTYIKKSYDIADFAKKEMDLMHSQNVKDTNVYVQRFHKIHAFFQKLRTI